MKERKKEYTICKSPLKHTKLEQISAKVQRIKIRLPEAVQLAYICNPTLGRQAGERRSSPVLSRHQVVGA